MFGDHQPGISIDGYINYNEDINRSVSEEYHVVPHIVWSNFDLDYEFPEYISANYLSAIIKDSIGLTLTSWDRFRLDVMDQYPVMTTNFILESQGNEVTDVSSSELLTAYSYIQYMRMFE